MQESDPAVRSRYMQGFMAHIPAVQRREVIAAIGPEMASTIGDAGPFAWLPIEVNVEATRAVAETLGPRATDTFFRTLAFRTFELPILKGLVSAVVRLARSLHVRNPPTLRCGPGER